MKNNKRIRIGLILALILMFCTSLALASDGVISIEDMKQILGQEPAPTPSIYPQVKVPAFNNVVGGSIGDAIIPGLVEGRTEVHTQATEEQILEYSQRMSNYGYTLYSSTDLTKDHAPGISFTYVKDQAKIVLLYDGELGNVKLIYQQGIDYVIDGAQSGGASNLLNISASKLTATIDGQQKNFDLVSAKQTLYGSYGRIEAIFEVRDSLGNVTERLALVFPAGTTTGSSYGMLDSAAVYVAYQKNGANLYSATKVPVADLGLLTIQYAALPATSTYQLNFTQTSGTAFQGTLHATLATDDGSTISVTDGSFQFQVD